MAENAADKAWNELLNKDDRPSPEEYPEMCLITKDELADFMALASPPSAAVRALEAAEYECWSIKCESYPTGGDDADVGWEVISHWQAEPRERVEGRGKTPLEALNDAINKGESKRIAAAR
jgi:hypothetical protein